MWTDKGHLDPHRKGTFTPRKFKINDFTIGKRALTEINKWLNQFKMSTMEYRYVDPEDVKKNAKKLLIPSISSIHEHKGLDDEDVIKNILDEEEIEWRLGKNYELLSLETQI